MALFVLVKRKGTKRIMGFFPGRKGVSRDKLAKIARKDVRSGFQVKVINSTQLKAVLKSLRNKLVIKELKKKSSVRKSKKRPKRRVMKRKVKRRRVMRKKK